MKNYWELSKAVTFNARIYAQTVSVLSVCTCISIKDQSFTVTCWTEAIPTTARQTSKLLPLQIQTPFKHNKLVYTFSETLKNDRVHSFKVIKSRRCILWFPFPVPLFDSGSPLCTSIPGRASIPPRAAAPRPFQTASPLVSIAASIISILVPPPVPAVVVPTRPRRGRRRQRTQTSAPASAPATSEPPKAAKQLSAQILIYLLDMHEIAVTTSVAVIFFKLPARSFAKIRNGGKINNNRSAGIKPTLHSLQSGGRLFFFSELDVNVSHHVICKVITNI